METIIYPAQKRNPEMISLVKSAMNVLIQQSQSISVYFNALKIKRTIFLLYQRKISGTLVSHILREIASNEPTKYHILNRNKFWMKYEKIHEKLD